MVTYDVEKTTSYRLQFSKLNLRFKRFVEEAVETVKQTPTDLPGKITHIGNKKDGGLYRFRVPGCYLMYVVPFQAPDNGQASTIILTGVQMLR